MDNTVIGQLPGHISEGQINDILNESEGLSKAAARIYRDMLLYYHDEELYNYSEVMSKGMHRNNPNMIEYLQLINDDRYDEFIRDIVNIVLQRDYMNITEQTYYDLIEPARIPKDISSNTMKRIVQILRIMRSIDQNITDTRNTLSPYELNVTLNRIADAPRGTAPVYAAMYMQKYPMIVKTGKPNRSDANILHEYLVGRVMNILRDTIPTFVYTYDIGLDQMIETVPNTGKGYYIDHGPRYSLYLEYIQNAESILNLDSSRSATVINNGVSTVYERSDLIRLILFQIFCAIVYAYYSVGFVHRDLNTTNILIVKLPTVMAIPIMVPVSYYRMSNRIVDVTFEYRVINTDILVRIIDYGQSTVRAEYLQNTEYYYKYLISRTSPHAMREGVAGLENDIAHLILGLSAKCYRLYYENYRADWDSLSEDFLQILYTMYTGSRLNSEEVNADDYTELFRRIEEDSDLKHYATHPMIGYNPHMAIIDFCSKYSDLFITDSDSVYENILTTLKNNSVDLIVDSTQKYYWYSNYKDIYGTVPVNIDIINNDQWYRENMIRPLVSDTIYNATVDNITVYEDINRRIINNSNIRMTLISARLLVHLVLSVYRYILYFDTFDLDIRPITYTNPRDILVDLIEYLNEANLSNNTKHRIGYNTVSELL